tara:strand:- start:295 stop:1221 length:927 start_codon:yes stop_codon:yes gene_type:complete
MENVKERTTVVFGGTGLVGSHLKADLKPPRSQVDLRDIDQVREFFRDNEFDTIVNCAGNVGGLGKNMKQNLEMFTSNMEMNYNLLKVIMENPGKIKKAVVFLSTCVFPAEVEYPLTEDKLHLGPPHFSNSGYAYAKRMTQVMVDLMNESGEYGKIITVIPTNLYGPHYTFNKEDGHVIPALIAKCYEAVLNDCTLTAWGSGSPLREFLYVEDVADIIEIILDTYESTKPLILSHGEEVTIKEAVLAVCEAMGLANISWDTSKPDGQHKKPSDPTALLEVIGDYKFTPLKEGVEKAVKFYRENFPNVRE